MGKLITLVVAMSLVIGSLAVPSPASAATSSGLWIPRASMPTGHAFATATLLTDNKVLIAGGDDHVNLVGLTGIDPSAAAALYRPLFDDWLSFPMTTGRALHGATSIAGGTKALVAGGVTQGSDIFVNVDCGVSSGFQASTSVEIFDLATLSWSTVASMNKGRADFSVVRLFDGRVLAGGGLTDTAAEIYDPGTNSWSSAGNMRSWRIGFSATLLPSGQVLYAGGNLGSVIICDRDAEIYDPGTNAWYYAGTPALNRQDAAAVLVTVADGTRRVLVTGGIDANSGSAPVLASAELYDPATNKWSNAASMSTPRVNHAATLMRDGRVLVTGGFNAGVRLASAEIYDPKTDTWSTVNSMSTARSGHTATLFGATPFFTKILVAGGRASGTTPLASAELFQPTPIDSTTTLLTSGACQPVELTAGVQSASGHGGPTGTVTFKDNGTIVGTAPIQSGLASLSPSVPDGMHSFTAEYGGDNAFNASASAAVSQQLNGAPTVTISGAPPGPSVLGTSLTLTASAGGGTAPYSFSWTRGGSLVGSGANLTDSPPLGANVYRARVTDANGCTGNSADTTVNVFDFTVSLTPVENTLYRNGPTTLASYTIQTGSAAGSATGGGPIILGLSVTGAPSDATVSHFTGVPLGGSSFLNVQTGPTSFGDFTLDAKASFGAASRHATALLHILKDTTAPEITPTVTGTLGNNGWYRSNVTVSWTVSDPETPFNSTGCGTSVLMTDTASMSFTCSATSDGGMASQTVNVKRDTTPPTLALSPVTANATSSAGANVSYAPPASDNLSTPTVSCAPASGSFFPIGDTTVNCTATDAAGNSTSGSFNVHVNSASQQVTNIISLVNNLPNAPGGSLNAKLNNILAALNAGQTANACSQLNAFINEVNAQKGKKISLVDANALITAAQDIKTALGCP